MSAAPPRFFIGAALLITLVGGPVSGSASDLPPHGSIKGKPKRVMAIGGYDYALPAWWDEVDVTVPEDLKTEDDIRKFVTARYKSDTGTVETWKPALKSWAIACRRTNHFPVYLGHCHKAGQDYVRAAEVFGDLYGLADGQKELRDWYRTYLAYNAGESYRLAGDPVRASTWYARAAEYVGYKDSAISYYAEQSAARLKMLKNK